MEFAVGQEMGCGSQHAPLAILEEVWGGEMGREQVRPGHGGERGGCRLSQAVAEDADEDAVEGVWGRLNHLAETECTVSERNGEQGPMRSPVRLLQRRSFRNRESSGAVNLAT